LTTLIERPNTKNSVAAGRPVPNVNSIRVFSILERLSDPVGAVASGAIAIEYT
jgi:hypothetical protein